jgi:hypothetical protein
MAVSVSAHNLSITTGARPPAPRAAAGMREYEPCDHNASV